MCRVDSLGTRPEWTRDGKRVVFTRGGPGVGISRPWDQNGAQEVLWKQPVWEVAVGAPHRFWAFRIGTAPSSNDIMIAPADSLDAMRPAVATPASEVCPRVSPNGRAHGPLLPTLSD